ncbi:type II secretion system F family protein, partial [Planctomycetota bacterium]
MATKIGQVYYNLSTLLDSGVPITRSLGTVVEPLSGKLENGFRSLQEGISQGHTLSETMAKHPGIFASLDVMIVKAADISGNLPQSLKLLSEWYDFRRRLRRIIISGLMLPFVVLHIAAIVGPLPALFLGASTSGQYLLEVIVTLALFYVPAVIIYVVFFLKPRKGPARRALDVFLLKIPSLGRAILYISLSRFCRSFYMLFSAGVPITECAETACDV